MKEINKTNQEQSISIAELRKDIHYIRRKVDNEIPHQVGRLDVKVDKLADKCDDILKGLFYGFIIFISATMLLQIILKLF